MTKDVGFLTISSKAHTIKAQANDDEAGNFEAGIATKEKQKTKRPARYRVLLLNDDYTPMDFVIHILQSIFNKQNEDAVNIMLLVHTQGRGEAGVFPYEIAETKVTQVMDIAIKNSHPLKCVMEKL